LLEDYAQASNQVQDTYFFFYSKLYPNDYYSLCTLPVYTESFKMIVKYWSLSETENFVISQFQNEFLASLETRHF